MNKKILNTVYTAMVAAMIFLLTRFVQVPVASGYVHFGDALIYIVVSTLGGGLSLFAAALGSVLADVTSGWAVYAPVTLIIKVLIAIPFALVNKKKRKDIDTAHRIVYNIIRCDNGTRIFPCQLRN